MKPKVAVLDYDIGNVKSVVKALEFVGADVLLTDEPSKVKQASGLVVPGVSSFGACVQSLKQKNLFDFLKEYILSGYKYLGICLGYQLLFEESEESPGEKGLAIFKGTVKKFPQGVRIPHIGWNEALPAKNTEMFEGIENFYFYFVHSFFPEPADRSIVSSYTDYGLTFASSIQASNVWACQFHPEKSSASGLRLLKNFVKWVGE